MLIKINELTVNKIINIFQLTTALILLVSNTVYCQSLEMQIIKDDLAGSNGIIFQDFNSDGTNEYIVARFSQDVVTLVYEDENGLQEIDLVTLDQPKGIVSGDFDLDGKIDIAVTAASESGITILRNLGNLEFSIQTINIFDFEEGGYLAASDLDNDGDLDLAVTSYKNDQIAIFELINPAFLSFNVRTIDFEVDNVGEISITDFNNDGNEDLVASVRFGNEVNVYFNDGLLNFDKRTMNYSGAIGNSITDFNNDGFMDFAVSSFSKNDVIIYINNGDETFEEYIIDESAQSATSIECFDINLDSKPDIVVGTSEGVLVYILEDVNTFQFAREDYFHDGWIGPFDIVDVDNDSDLDVVASSTSIPGIVHYINLTINIVDNDNDGFNSDEDCDDDNNQIYPGAEEIPDNGIDEDCDGADLTTSLHYLSLASINIYPSPTSGFVQLDIVGTLNFKVSIYSLSGKLILHEMNKNMLDISSLIQGTYLLEIEDLDSRKTIVERIVKTN